MKTYVDFTEHPLFFTLVTFQLHGITRHDNNNKLNKKKMITLYAVNCDVKKVRIPARYLQWPPMEIIVCDSATYNFLG